MNRRTLVLNLLAYSLFGHAHWFFGNLYEAVVTAPQGIASPESIHTETSLFAFGSPVI